MCDVTRNRWLPHRTGLIIKVTSAEQHSLPEHDNVEFGPNCTLAEQPDPSSIEAGGWALNWSDIIATKTMIPAPSLFIKLNLDVLCYRKPCSDCFYSQLSRTKPESTPNS